MAQGALGAAGIRRVWAAACSIQAWGHIARLPAQLVLLTVISTFNIFDVHWVARRTSGAHKIVPQQSPGAVV